MNLICDTNVWYDISTGLRDPVKLKAPGHRLLCTPISFFEIAAGIQGKTLAERRAAALAVVQNADEIIEDSETHMVRQFGIQVANTVDWMQGFKGISQAPSVQDLTTGVADFFGRVIRRVNVALTHTWWEHHSSDFATGGR